MSKSNLYLSQKLTRDEWEFSIAPVKSRDGRWKHYIMLRFRALNHKKHLAYRSVLMLTRKTEVKDWTNGLRKFADMIDAFLIKEARHGKQKEGG